MSSVKFTASINGSEQAILLLPDSASVDALYEILEQAYTHSILGQVVTLTVTHPRTEQAIFVPIFGDDLVYDSEAWLLGLYLGEFIEWVEACENACSVEKFNEYLATRLDEHLQHLNRVQQQAAAQYN